MRLDTCSGGAYTDGMAMHEYAERCSEQVDEATLSWQVVHGAAHKLDDGCVRVGRVEGDGACMYLSTMWTTRWSNVPNKHANALLLALDQVLNSNDIAKHAREWDRTFVSANILADVPDRILHGQTARLVSWEFAASPLWDRDLLYVIAKQKSRNWGADITTYSYASVNNAWAEKLLGKTIPASGRVRATILFPSCDRVSVTTGEGMSTKTITLDHLMTTSVGGWIGPCLFNTCFKAPLIKANVHELGALRAYVESIAGQYE